MVQPATGDIPGLPEAVADWLAHYHPGGEGLNGLSSCVVSLTIEEWALWNWIEVSTQAYTAAQDSLELMFTVPMDERAWLETALLEIATGDNTMSQIRIQPPAPYGSGTRDFYILELSTATTPIFWPDTGGVQSNVRYVMGSGPVLLEPGTTIHVLMGGEGVSAGNVRGTFCMRRTKLVRARTP